MKSVYHSEVLGYTRSGFSKYKFNKIAFIFVSFLVHFLNDILCEAAK